MKSKKHRQAEELGKKEDQHEREHNIYCLPSLNPSSAGALPSSFGRADVNSLTGLGSKCLIRSGEKNDLFNTSGPIKYHSLDSVLYESQAGVAP